METKNLTKEEVNNIISTFPYEPIFNKVIITLNKDEVNLNLTESSLSEIQYIVAGNIKFGNTEIVPGDKVLIDLKSLQRPFKTETNNTYETVFQIEIDPIFVEDNMYTIVNDRSIKAKINE